MSVWRNWQARTFQRRMEKSVRVRVPGPTPCLHTGLAERPYAAGLEPVGDTPSGFESRDRYHMRECWNWQTGAVEGRVRQLVGVRVPPPAPYCLLFDRAECRASSIGRAADSLPNTIMGALLGNGQVNTPLIRANAKSRQGYANAEQGMLDSIPCVETIHGEPKLMQSIWLRHSPRSGGSRRLGESPTRPGNPKVPGSCPGRGTVPY